MIKLDTIQIASPCHADWEAMVGDDQVRFCDGCRKNVYNLSEMTHAEAEGLVNRLEGKLCVRFYTRPDGTALTSDCPVGLRAVRYRRLRKFSYAAALMLAGMGGLLRGSGSALGDVSTAKTHKAMPKPKPVPSLPLPSSSPPPPVLGKLAAPKATVPSVAVPSVIMPKTTPPVYNPINNPMMTMGLVEWPRGTHAPVVPIPENSEKKPPRPQ